MDITRILIHLFIGLSAILIALKTLNLLYMALFPESPRRRSKDLEEYRVSFEIPFKEISSCEVVKATGFKDAEEQAKSRIIWMYKVDETDIIIISVLKL